MIRTRILALGATAAIGLTGAFAPAAVAGSHWSSSKCIKTYTAYYKKHSSKGSLTTKQAKELSSYQKKLEHQHHCRFGG
ncbi:MAG: hypothetical protein WB709_13870 [Solirubrobacteraceae bacterium]|jgi:hypothetical protein